MTDSGPMGGGLRPLNPPLIANVTIFCTQDESIGFEFYKFVSTYARGLGCSPWRCRPWRRCRWSCRRRRAATRTRRPRRAWRRPRGSSACCCPRSSSCSRHAGNAWNHSDLRKQFKLHHQLKLLKSRLDYSWKYEQLKPLCPASRETRVTPQQRSCISSNTRDATTT